MRDLDRAYQNFFRRLKNGEKPGFPKFKFRKRSKKSFRLTGAIRVEESRINERSHLVFNCYFLPSEEVALSVDV